MDADVEKIRNLLTDNGITVSELSKISGVSRATIHRVNSGVKVKPVTIGKIARALGVKVEDLI